MLCCSLITVLLIANLFNSGDAAVNFTTPTGGDASITVVENLAVGTVVETIAATSEGALGDFVLVTTGSPFALAGDGALTVNESVLDFETTPSYTLLIRGQDDVGGGSSATATLTVDLTDANDEPSFTSASYYECLFEGKSIGETVTTFSASDQDTGDTLTYTITSGNTNVDFWVSSTSLEVANQLNRSTTASYILVISVTDGNSSATANYNIAVESTCGASTLAANLTALLIGLVYSWN